MKPPSLHLVFAIALAALASSARAAGDLQPPPGAPGPTMKSLQEIYDCFEKRIRIPTLPATINSDGAYYFDGDITVSGSGANGITIGAGVKKVVIDLGGRTLTGQSGTGHGIDCSAMPGGTVALRNGVITGFSGDGVRAPTCRVIASEMEFYNQGGRCIVCGDESVFAKILSKNAGGTVIQGGANLIGTEIRVYGAQGKGVTATHNLTLKGCIFSGGALVCNECQEGTFASDDSTYESNLGECVRCPQGNAVITRGRFRLNVGDCVKCPLGSATMSDSTYEGNTGKCITAKNLIDLTNSSFRGNTGLVCAECEEGTLSARGGGFFNNGGICVKGLSGVKVTDVIFDHNAGIVCVECPQGSMSVRDGRFTGNSGVCVKGSNGALVGNSIFDKNTGYACVECPQGTMATEGCKYDLSGACTVVKSSGPVIMKGCHINGAAGTADSGPFDIAAGGSLRIDMSTILVSSKGLHVSVEAGLNGVTIRNNNSTDPCPPGNFTATTILIGCDFTNVGVGVGAGSVVKDCSSTNPSGHSYTGFEVGESSTVTNCTVNGCKRSATYAGNGIVAGANSLVKNCVVGDCDGNGIVIRERCSALQNVVCKSGINVAATVAGIRCEAGPATIDGNSTTQNDVGIELVGTGTTVTRNKVSANTTAINGSSGNDVAPLTTAAAAVNPFSNFQ